MYAGSGAQMAHLMAHNFGLDHDDEIGCTQCDDPIGQCIMHSKSVSTASKRSARF